MADGKHMFFAAAGSLVVLMLGIALLAWPSYRQTREVRNEVAALEKKVSSLSARTADVERLASEFSDLRRQVENNLKAIPESPDVAERALQKLFELKPEMVYPFPDTPGK